MHPEGIPLHLGVNYVIAPSPEIDKTKYLAFQNALMEAGIDYDGGQNPAAEIQIIRRMPPLEIRVISREDAPIGQLLLIASHPNRSPDDFSREAEAIVRAFSKTWDTPQQILSCDATIRYLHETSSEHAFKELWETRLGQTEGSLRAFGRRVLGGGLRFVMPPAAEDVDAAQVEVKIESYLRDTKKIFVEVGFKWLRPAQPGTAFDPRRQLQAVDSYVDNEVTTFIQGEGG